jgi:hypothetical protein
VVGLNMNGKIRKIKMQLNRNMANTNSLLICISVVGTSVVRAILCVFI